MITTEPQVFEVNGKKVINFAIGCTIRYGEKSLEHIQCALWEPLCDEYANFLKLKAQLLFKGNLAIKTYKDKNGAYNKSLHLNVTDVAAID